MLNSRVIHDDMLPDRAPCGNTLADYTEPSLMVPRLSGRDAATLTGELCSTLHRKGRISDLRGFYDAVISRESLSSTAMVPGWAVPHARLAGISQLSFALGRSEEPLAWFGGKPANTIFLFAVPETEAAAYLTLISGLAKLSQDRLRLERLADASDSQAMFEVLQGIRLPQRRSAFVNA
jgi:mannitol/fructose-specific phosphotransferase system IIA component (Ntr-type)